MAPPSYRNRADIWARDPKLAQALDDIHAFVKQGQSQVGINVSGEQSQGPPQISAFNVVGADGVVDVQISDNNPITRAIEYHVEYSLTPDFAQPHGWSLGPWRVDRKFLGKLTLYFRAYSQYSPVSPPSPLVYFGNPPTAVYLGGAISGPAQQASTGSGTASNDGRQGGSGAGLLPTRGNPSTT